jgi:hypothetical protein
MLATQTDVAIETRTALFGVPRRADGDYANEVFRCPKHPEARQYQSVRPPVLHDDQHAPYVSSHCYWCDARGRLRGHPEFDRSAPQCHCYPLIGGDDG